MGKMGDLFSCLSLVDNQQIRSQTSDSFGRAVVAHTYLDSSSARSNPLVSQCRVDCRCRFNRRPIMHHRFVKFRRYLRFKVDALSLCSSHESCIYRPYPMYELYGSSVSGRSSANPYLSRFEVMYNACMFEAPSCATSCAPLLL